MSPGMFTVTLAVVAFLVIFIFFVLLSQAIQRQQETRSIGYTCCTSGSLSITARLDRGGYYVGDEVMASLYIDNKSSRDVTEIEMYLCQKTTYAYGTSKSHC